MSHSWKCPRPLGGSDTPVHAWQTEASYLINIGIIDKATLVSTGSFYDLRAFRGLNFLRIQDNVVSVGHDDDADMATWRVLYDADVLLYQYAVEEYPLDASESGDAAAVHLVENLGSNAKLLDYGRVSGEELRALRFQG